MRFAAYMSISGKKLKIIADALRSVAIGGYTDKKMQTTYIE